MPITSPYELDVNASYTYADYATWKFEQMVELIKGKLFILSPAPASRHQSISSGLAAQILPYFLRSEKCNAFTAPYDVRLAKGKALAAEVITVVQPDISIICDPSKIDARGCLGSPDWIIEIISPSTAKKDYNEKFNLYQENGVKEYWLVNPDANMIDNFVLDDAGVYQQNELFTQNQTVSPAIFPELKIELEWVFRHTF